MRICIQSGTPLGTSDIYRPYYESLLRHARKVASPGELVEIPVVFMTQATLSFYSQLAPNFAFIVNGERLHYFFEDMAERYKVKQRMVPGGYVSFAFTDYANLWGNPQPFVEQFMEAARELVRRGATSLYPAGLYLSQWLIDQGIREVEGAIIMDPLAVGIRTAELMAGLERTGIKPYRQGRWAVPSEEVRSILAAELGFERQA